MKGLNKKSISEYHTNKMLIQKYKLQMGIIIQIWVYIKIMNDDCVYP